MAILMDIYSEDKQTRKPRGVRTFYKLVLRNIRRGGEDYLFTNLQVEHLKSLLKENEKLIVETKGDYIIVKLEDMQ